MSQRPAEVPVRGWRTLLLPGVLAATAALAAEPPPGGAGASQTLEQGVVHDALFAIAFDGATGIATGVPGRVLNTRDGGKTWALDKAFPSPLAMLGADLKGARAIAVGQMGSVFTREGDSAWAKAETGTTERLMNVGLNRAGLAVAVGAFGTVIKSADGGKTWQPAAPDWKPYLSADQADQGIQPHVAAVSVNDQGTITIGCEFSLILRSTDGGATWKAVHRGEGDAAIFALELRDDGVGYAVGQDGLILRTTDGGTRWARVPAPSKANLLGVRSAGDRVVASAMHDMLTSGDGGRSWQRVQSPDVQVGWYSGVAVTGSTFMAVGHTGRIIKLNL